MVVHHFNQPATPSRVVILGAHGFLAEEVERNLAAAGISRRAVGSKEVDLTDLSSASLLSGIVQPDDALVVTSALTPDRGRDPATLLKNIRMAESLALFLERARCAHVVYISSDGIYDPRLSLVSEDSPCETGDMYAVAHVVREKILAQACQKAGVPLILVRPCAIYGAGDTHNSYGPNRFIRSALQDGKIVLFGGGEEKRDHIYVKDVAEIIRRCLVHRSAGVLNAVTGSAWSFRELAQKVAAVLGQPVAIQQMPRSSPITHKHYDIAALIRAFPDFQSTALERGLSETAAGMRAIRAGAI